MIFFLIPKDFSVFLMQFFLLKVALIAEKARGFFSEAQTSRPEWTIEGKS